MTIKYSFLMIAFFYLLTGIHCAMAVPADFGKGVYLESAAKACASNQSKCDTAEDQLIDRAGSHSK